MGSIKSEEASGYHQKGSSMGIIKSKEVNGYPQKGKK
jgi:hypothetical protein